MCHVWLTCISFSNIAMSGVWPGHQIQAPREIWKVRDRWVLYRSGNFSRHNSVHTYGYSMMIKNKTQKINKDISFSCVKIKNFTPLLHPERAQRNCALVFLINRASLSCKYRPTYPKHENKRLIHSSMNEMSLECPKCISSKYLSKRI